MNVKIAIAGVLLIFAIFLFSGCATEESSSTLATETPLASKGVPSASPPGTLGPNETPTNTPQTATPTPSEMPPSAYLPEVPRISVDEVKAKLDAGFNIVIIDSRSKSSYDNSRIPGAISLPLADMAEPYSDLDRYEEIITYCTWVDENLSARAAKKLIDAGYSNVKTIEGGLGDWKRAQYPVEQTTSE